MYCDQEEVIFRNMAVNVLFWLLVCLFGRFAEANTSLSWFDFYDGKVLSGHNDEVIGGINEEECARRCLVGTSTVPSGSCLSFDYDNQYSKCILSRSNKDTPGAVFSYSDPPSRFDYYHRTVFMLELLPQLARHVLD
ncbi:Hypp6993 [Branchiostoma lanceolatum]|uniref:Hypp6993 protein n=1 Tax=Branchiostoma lanceolatum TaxID=7740 RepID=A0A8K0EB08_BRALA|nr:Hypp6993 [Branchiostoma lanceolatum]